MTVRTLVVLTVLVVGLGLCIGPVAGDSATEGTVELDLEPGRTDTVTVSLPGDTTDPERWMERRANEAELPVYDVSAKRESVRATGSNIDSVFDSASRWDVTLKTSLGEPTGFLQREIEYETIAGLSPGESPTISVQLPARVPIEAAQPTDRGLFVHRYAVSETEAIVYGFSPVAVGTALGPVVATIVALYGSFRVYGNRIVRADIPTAEKNYSLVRAFKFWELLSILPLTGLLIFGGLVDLAALLTESVLSRRIGGLWWLLSSHYVTIVTVYGANWLSIHLALGQVVRQLDESELEESDFEILRGAGVRWIITAIVLWPLLLALLLFSPWLASRPLVTGVLFSLSLVLYAGLSPAITRRFERTQPISGPVVDDVEQLCDEFRLGVPALYRLETSDSKRAYGVLDGIPGRWSIFLTDGLLESEDDGMKRAMVAYLLAHIVKKHFLKRVAFATVFVSLLVFVFIIAIGIEILAVALPVLCYLFLGRKALSRRQVFTADKLAAAVVGWETYVVGLESMAAANDVKRDTGTVFNLLTGYPSIAERIDRLQGETGTPRSKRDSINPE